ncbi:F0F1 ATP synthase subunit gamma [Bombella sp. TMW 2.2543]|uniref:ATP synthase gamma chain n=1 Tax=Bombella pluederhausensis TaxID=2967336 RepID=A0ABT3WHY7_9PROT|nr:F0F1 ATP synthase subunit gamma [Bombella pluederhausensis]MCX5618700.1 F0F1 ATP synthase subunit gamma [Bombella pluederhausensis]
MASLKELRGRIAGVKSTRKITSAMKMVAASKLRRAQNQAEAARPYAETMQRMMSELATASKGMDPSTLPPLLAGTGKDDVHLLVILTSDRGLAGGFNANIIRTARQQIDELKAKGRTVRLLPVGRKGAEIFKRYYPEMVVDSLHNDSGTQQAAYALAQDLAKRIGDLVEGGEIDACSLLRNRFVNAMTQQPESLALVPLPVAENDNTAQPRSDGAVYEFEPDEGQLLAQLLPRNLLVQFYAAILESAAGEQGARMTAMDNASRNASKAIDRLSLTYNRTRQANITNELIEIISGAEAV